jgi:hypothetical protein
VFRTRRDDDSAAIGDAMLHTVENRNAISGLDSDELIQCMSFLANLFFRPKTHQNELAIFTRV